MEDNLSSYKKITTVTPSHPPMRKAYSDPVWSECGQSEQDPTSLKSKHRSDQDPVSMKYMHQSDLHMPLPSYSDAYNGNSQYHNYYSFYHPAPPSLPTAITPFTYSRSLTPPDSSYYGGYGRGYEVIITLFIIDGVWLFLFFVSSHRGWHKQQIRAL